MAKEPLQPQDKYIVRMPDGMRDRIAAAARSNNRSMNAEIVATLHEAYPPPQKLTETIEQVKDIVAEMKKMKGPAIPSSRLDSLLQEMVLDLEGLVESWKRQDEEEMDPGA